jgi:hypothetical protein
MNIGDIPTKGWAVIAHNRLVAGMWHWHYDLTDVAALREAVYVGAITTAQQRCEGGFRLLAKRVGR